MGSQNRKQVSIFIHLLVWCLFLALPLLPMLVHEPPPTQVILNIYLHLGSVMVAYYMNFFWLIPKFLFQGKRRGYLLAVVSMVIVMMAINAGMSHLFGMDRFIRGFHPPANWAVRIVRMEFIPLLLTILAVSLGLAIRLTGRWLSEQKGREQLENERLHAELAFLKAQINPHFFFNTMNLIYALTETDPEKAQHAIHKLSKLMRYVLYESERPRVELSREIAFLEDYLDLMRMRLPENIELEFECRIQNQTALVPPLLMVPFVENALKYGVTTKERKQIRFELAGEEALQFRAVNAVYKGKQVPADQKGVGLVNVRRRLGLLYPGGNFSLDISEAEGKYVVDLKIPME